MHKKHIKIFALAVVLSPLFVFANCSNSGYSVVYVNGILTSKNEAFANNRLLQDILGSSLDGQKVLASSAYNPTHLNGLGDVLQSITQAFSAPVSDYDLKTMLIQLHSDLTTRKVLLVGHSQGTFYANEMYNYLTTHGVPKESIAVYNIATPASYVAGGGTYLTSSNDKLINMVRDKEVNGNLRLYADSYYTIGNAVSSALRANVAVPKEDGYDADEYGGHHFSESYLNGAGARIVSDIDTALGRLRASGTESPECFNAPEEDLSYKIEKGALAIADPLAARTSSITQPVINGALALIHGVTNGFASLGSIFAGTNTSSQTAAVLPAIDTENQSTQASAPSLQPTSISDTSPPRQPPPIQSTPPLPSTTQQVPAKLPIQPVQQSFTVQPGFGGGGDSGVSSGSTSATSQSAPTNTNPAQASLTITAPLDQSVTKLSSVEVSGTADGGAIISATWPGDAASTTADSNGNWTFSATLPEGATVFTIGASVNGKSDSATQIRTVTVDTTPPSAPVVSLPDCVFSLSAVACLVPTTSISAQWTDVSDASSYAVVLNGAVQNQLTGTSTILSIADRATSTIAIVAYDAAGNAATSSDVLITAYTQPLIINEIGWGGDGDPTHQWIEFRNISPYAIHLSGVSLERVGASSISLTGDLSNIAGNYLVLESGNFSFMGSNTYIAPFDALSASGEELRLVWNGTVIDRTPATTECNAWCAGSASATLGSNVSGLPSLTTPLSMERIDGTSDGSQKTSWQNTDSYGPWIGTGGGLWGTPGIENSRGYPEAGVYCAAGLIEDREMNPGGGCTYLAKFITGSTNGATRTIGLFRGSIGSSTPVAGNEIGKALAGAASTDIPADAQDGERFFYAIWEVRYYIPVFDGTEFTHYFVDGTSLPPHGNYATFPFTYKH